MWNYFKFEQVVHEMSYKDNLHIMEDIVREDTHQMKTVARLWLR